jgi:DNA primase
MDVVRLHQAGITYAVATLGTATTTEHLTRVFRICNELVFCFDGDRAGRAAAWRALENSLPHVREGRQLRFLFLPDGHDPDSLVGEEGREAFESRLSSALPLSEYLLNHLATQADLTSAEGRTLFAQLAQPLLEKIPEGHYRDLVGKQVKEKARLVNSLDFRHMSPHLSTVNPAAPLRPNLDSGSSVGRGSVVRQAVRILVHHPSVATEVNSPPGLQDVKKPGVPLLIELLNELRLNPCASAGALLERWRGRPDLGHLTKLAQETLLIEPSQAVHELTGALNKVVLEGLVPRVEELSRKPALTDSEKLELQRLLPIVNRITH